MFLHHPPLTIRPLHPPDAPLMAKWLSDPTVLEWYEGRDRPHDLAMIQATFLKKQGNPVQACIIEWDTHPIGYLQFYPIADDDRDFYGYSADQVIYGLDQFIGEPAYWNRGLGTHLIKAMTDCLISTRGAHKVVLDPQARNTRAIRCYEKCGFRKVKLLPAREMHEGILRDCWLMEYNGS